MGKITKKSETKTKSLNASQKLIALEGLTTGLQQQIQILAEEIDKIGQVVQLLARRLNASNQIANISSDSVTQVIVDENAKSLESKVQMLIDKGIAKRSSDGLIKDEQCFVVGREIDKDGNVIAPRIQFAVASLVADLKPKFIGQKEGSLFKNDDSESSIEIMEVYDIIPPKKEIKFDKDPA
ncbi:MAG TPA: hypothetical protein VI911_11630 [Patescibacteria group bacterium]|nr:hypothetical protein [Patescibacteria group bacterium]